MKQCSSQYSYMCLIGYRGSFIRIDFVCQMKVNTSDVILRGVYNNYHPAPRVLADEDLTPESVFRAHLGYVPGSTIVQTVLNNLIVNI